MFDEILVPVDGSDGAAAALERAVGWAGRFDATLHLLTVVDPRFLTKVSDVEPHRNAAERFLEETVVPSLPASVARTTAVRTGVPHREILDCADDCDADAIAMGTHGRTGVQRYLLGSVAERVVRLSAVPVLTVRPSEAEATDPSDAGTEEPTYEHVLVPTDGSESARAAVAVAAAVASAYDATLVVLSVADTRTAAFVSRSPEIRAAVRDAAAAAVETTVEECRRRGVTSVETAVEAGDPAETIRSFVADRDVDLVAMGTHGRTGLERYLLGSVTERVVRTSPVPVLTVRGPVGADSDASEAVDAEADFRDDAAVDAGADFDDDTDRDGV